MTTKRTTQAASVAVIVLGYLVGMASYPYLPGIALDRMPGTRAQIAFSLPTTILVIYLIFRSLWRHDRIR